MASEKTAQLFQINWTQVITALATGLVIGAVGILRVADSNTVVIATNSREISELKEDIVPRAEFDAVNESLQLFLERQQIQLDRIEQKIDRL